MIVLNFLLAFVSFPRVSTENVLKSHFPLYGISEIGAKNYAEKKNSCNDQLKIIFNALDKREKWALKLLYSSGSPGGGFAWGNNYWLGSYSRCLRISSGKEAVSPSNRSPFELQPFPVSFFVGLLKQIADRETGFDAASERTIHLGLCLPSICSADDLKPFISEWANENPLRSRSIFNFTMELQSVRLIKTNRSWICDRLTIAMGLTIFVAAFLTVSATIYDFYVLTPIRNGETFDGTRKIGKKEIRDGRNIIESSDLLKQDYNMNECYEVKIDNFQHKSMPVHVIKAVEESSKVDESKRNFFVGLISSFSVISKVKKKISGRGNSKAELSIVRGIRFLALNWIIWLHLVHRLESISDENRLTVSFSDENFRRRINSSFSFDTIFFATGFILAYKYYRNRWECPKFKFSVKKKVNEFGSAALTRYLRLTPIQVLTIGLAMIVVKATRQTSLFEAATNRDDETCRKNWWRNVAYMNNLFGEDQRCLPWSWYSSMDMQFFLSGLFLLILSTRFRKTFLVSTSGLILVSSLFAGYNYSTSKEKRQPRPNEFLYTSPWTRTEPFLVGILTASFVVNWKGELALKKVNLFTCWMLAIASSAWALFGLYMSHTWAPLHAALSRLAWSFALSWLVIACGGGEGGPLRWIVTASSGWTMVDRLHYTAYLISPLIIGLMTANGETAINLDSIQTIIYFFGTLPVIYFSSFLIYSLFELPLRKFGKRRFASQKTIQNQLDRSP